MGGLLDFEGVVVLLLVMILLWPIFLIFEFPRSRYSKSITHIESSRVGRLSSVLAFDCRPDVELFSALLHPLLLFNLFSFLFNLLFIFSLHIDLFFHLFLHAFDGDPLFVSNLSFNGFILFLELFLLMNSLFFLFLLNSLILLLLYPILECSATLVLFILLIHFFMHFDFFQIFKGLDYVMLLQLLRYSFFISPLFHGFFPFFRVNFPLLRGSS